MPFAWFSHVPQRDGYANSSVSCRELSCSGAVVDDLGISTCVVCYVWVGCTGEGAQLGAKLLSTSAIVES